MLIPYLEQHAGTKIAICISGHLRTIEKTIPFMKKNLFSDTTRLFVHTWHRSGYEAAWHNGDRGVETTETMLDRLEMVPPTVFVTEDETIFKPRRPIEKVHMSLESMFYKIKKCNELRQQYEKQHKMTFDFIVRMRGDLEVDTKLDYRALRRDTIYIPPSNADYKSCDLFAVGSPEAMDKYCLAYDSFPIYYDKVVDSLKEKEKIRPEMFLKWHLEQYVKVPKILLNLHINLIRLDGSRTNW